MKKVYVVDDDKDIVEYITTILDKEGYQTKCQHDEKNVVENVKAYAPDVIILDVMFPEDESAGFTIARNLRADDAIAKIPILMLSAVNERGLYPGKFSNDDRDDSYLPVDAFVEKPISPDDLVQKIGALTS